MKIHWLDLPPVMDEDPVLEINKAADIRVP